MKIGRILAVFVVFTLLFASVSIMIPLGSAMTPVPEKRVPSLALTPQTPLRINSNADFPLNGFTGAGTVLNPYVLDSKDINAAGSRNGIFIGNTTAYFVIQNSNIYGASTAVALPGAIPYSLGSGITLYNVVNGVLDNCTITSSTRGISVISSSSVSIQNNTIYFTTEDGLFLNGLTGSLISGNSIDSTGFDTMFLDTCSGNSIEYNSLFSATFNGITLWSSDSNAIHHNHIMINGNVGLLIDGSTLNLVYDNHFLYNAFEGVVIQFGSTSNSIYRNYFLGNNGSTDVYSAANIQAYADAANTWTDGTFGNVWNDWLTPDVNFNGIVDSPYSIPNVPQNDPSPLSGAAGPPQNLALTTGWLYVSLTWDASPYSLFTPVNSYIIYRSDNPTTPIGFVNGNTLSYVDGTVAANTQYTYWVVAMNVYLGQPSATQTITTLAVQPPFVVSITSPANGYMSLTSSVTFNWAMTSGTATSYETNIDNLGWVNMGTAVSQTVNGLVDGPHVFQVRANGAGPVQALDSVSFTVDTIAPIVDVYSPLNNSMFNVNSVMVSWSVIDSGSGADFSEYQIDGGAFVNAGAGSIGSHQFTGLANGWHIVGVRATDLAARLGPVTNVYFLVDTVGPTVTISSPAANSFVGTSTVLVTWTGNDGTGSGVASYDVRVDTGAWVPVGLNLSFTTGVLTEAPHTVSVRAYDVLGNLGTAATVAFTVDLTSPTVTFVAPLPTLINTTSTTVSWTGSDGLGSGINHYELKLDAGAWTNEGTATSKLLTSLTDGAHTLLLRAVDNIGRVSTNATYSFTVDATGPTVTITAPATAYVNTETVQVTWTGTDGAGTGITGYSVRVDGGAWTPVALNLQITLGPLAVGAHTVDVRATDGAGNVGAPDSVTFTIDVTGPTVTITAPVNGALIGDNTTAVTWTGSDGAGSGVAYYEYRIDGGAWTNNALTLSATFTGLTDGLHTVDVRANDTAGNMGAISSVSFTIDTTAPVVVITAPTLTYLNQPGTNVIWTGTDAVGIAYFEIRLDGGAWNNVGLATNWTLSGLTEGSHTFYVRANDTAGNLGLEASVTFVIDVSSPTVTIVSPVGPYLTNSTVIVIWNGADTVSGVKEYAFSLDTGAWQVTGLVNETTLTNLAQGEHRVEVRVTDNAGNINTAVVIFIIDSIVPTVSITSPSEGALINVSSVIVTWTAADGGSGIDTIEIGLGGTWTAVTGTNYALTGLTEGAKAISVRVTDIAGNQAVALVNVTIDTIAPTVTIVSPVGPYLDNSTAIVVWNGADTGSGVKEFAYRLDNGAWTVTGLVNQTTLIDLAQGEHRVEVRVTDNADNIDTAVLIFFVDTTNPTVEITSPSEGAWINVSTVTVVWTAADVGSGIDTIEIGLGGTWTAVTGTNYALTGLTEGAKAISVRVTDLAGNQVVALVNVTIDTTDPTVTGRSPEGVGVALGSVIIVTFSEAMDQDTVTISIAGVIGSVTWEGNVATFTPSATLSRDKTYDVSVEGSDLAGNAMTPLSWSFETLTSAATVTGKIVDADGNPVEGVSIRLDDTLVAETDANGDFQFQAAPGTYTLDIGKDGMKNDTQEITLEVGGSVSLGAIEIADESSGGGDNTMLIIVVVLVIVVVLGAVVYMVRIRKK